MTLHLSRSVFATLPGLSTSVIGLGGKPPYVYSLELEGAGGVIDSLTGIYTAPAIVNPDPEKAFDKLVVTDSSFPPNIATGQILVTNVLGLFCDILARELDLSPERVYFWDQKINQPVDSDLYIAVSIPSAKPFGNNTKTGCVAGIFSSIQEVNMMATFDMDIISRGPAARERKEEVILALNSIYSQSQQEVNGFYIGKLPPGARFLNLSQVDGAAIPYRFKISVNVQYTVTKTKAVPYYDNFEQASLTINP